MTRGEKTLRDILESRDAVNKITYALKRINALTGELDIDKYRKIIHIGCGSSYYSAELASSRLLGGKYHHLSIPSSELIFYYRDIIEPDTLVIAVSRSGKTAETLHALEISKKRGATTVMISNSEEPGLPEAIDYSIYVDIGEERSIVMTKSFLTLSAAGLLLSDSIMGHEPPSFLDDFKKYVDSVVDDYEELLSIGERLASNNMMNMVFLGQGPSYPIAREASLKFKETSYIPTEALHALEFRHGPISTINNPGELVVLIIPDGRSYDKVLKLYNEIRSHGGKTLLLSNKGEPDIRILDVGDEHWAALSAILPIQLIALGYALQNGNDPDQPRNLTRYISSF